MPAARPPEAGVVPVGQVTHGLNNTLTVINGFSELSLGAMSECDPHRRYVEEIQRAGQHAAELTQQLLSRAGLPPAKAAGASRTLRELAHEHSSYETIQCRGPGAHHLRCAGQKPAGGQPGPFGGLM